MEKNEVFDSLAAGTMNRRDFNRALASVGLAAITVPFAPGAARAAGEITYFAWGGYDDPNTHKDYSEKYGGSPAYGLFGDEEEALQKMRAGYQPDLAHPCAGLVGRWRDSGLFKPIDVSRLDHYGDVFPELKTLKFTQDNGTWFTPFDWGNSSVLYRTDLVDPAYIEEESWNILFDERYKGRLGTFDNVDGAVIVAALVAGVPDPFNMNDAEIEQVRKLMQGQRELLRFYWTDQTMAEQGLASGELVASYAWNDAVVRLKAQGLPVAYMNPKEGILTWVCGVMMLKDGPGDEQAKYDFIDAMLAPESGAYVIDTWGFGHSNAKAFDLVSAERLAELGISSPTALFKQGVFFKDIPPEAREKYIAMFEEVKAGY